MVALALLPFMIASFFSGLEARFVFTGAYTSGVVLSSPAEFGQAFEEVTITTEDDVELAAWLMPNAESELWFLYLHGQGGNIGAYLGLTTELAQHHNVLSLDYRGYGNSAGIPSEAGLYKDALAAYGFLRARGVSANRIVPYGFSLGSGVAVDLASKVEVAALIVEAGYTSLKDAARAIYRVPASLVRQDFNSALKIANVNAPVAFIHAADDITIPLSQGQKLFDLAAEPKTFIEISGGHASMMTGAQPGVLDKLDAFLETHLN